MLKCYISITSNESCCMSAFVCVLGLFSDSAGSYKPVSHITMISVQWEWMSLKDVDK